MAFASANLRYSARLGPGAGDLTIPKNYNGQCADNHLDKEFAANVVESAHSDAGGGARGAARK